MDTMVAFGDEIEELLKQSISQFVAYAKRLPDTDYSGPYLACLDAVCRDARYPAVRCETCDKAMRGHLGRPMQVLVCARRGRLASARSFADCPVRMVRAGDIADVLGMVNELHDHTCAIALNAQSISSDDVEPIRTGRRGGLQTRRTATA